MRADADSVQRFNTCGRGHVVLVCEHATNHVPAAFGGLGLGRAALDSHIAWDPGALAVAREMSLRLDAPLLAPTVSRLIYDCNRPPEAPDAIPARSERFDIPGNAGLGDAERRARAEAFYSPFRRALNDCLDARSRGARRPVLVTVHSFTPVYADVRRAVELGVLHDADPRLAAAILDLAKADSSLIVRRNEPYGPADGVTHTLATHGIARGLLNVMLEIRNDLIATPETQRSMAERLATWVAAALARISADTDGAVS